MKELSVKDLRVGNTVLYNKRAIVNLEIEDFYEFAINDKYIDYHISPIPITEDILLKMGFECHSSLIDSYNLDVTGITLAHSETISLVKNNDKNGLFYLFFRQGDYVKKSDFHKNSMVLLRRDLEYVHDLQNIVKDLTQKELTYQP